MKPETNSTSSREAALANIKAQLEEVATALKRTDLNAEERADIIEHGHDVAHTGVIIDLLYDD
jgi:hypothetical protein